MEVLNQVYLHCLEVIFVIAVVCKATMIMYYDCTCMSKGKALLGLYGF